MNFLNIITVFILIFIILTVAHIAYLHYQIRKLNENIIKLRCGILNIIRATTNIHIPDEWMK